MRPKSIFKFTFLFCGLLLLCAHPACGADNSSVWAKGSPEAVRAAAQREKNLNTPDSKGKTPLIYAAESNSAAAVTILLDLGANPNIPNINGFSPLMFAALYNSDKHVITALLQRNASVDFTDANGKTALIHAASYKNGNRSDAIVALLQGCADPFAADNDGKRAVDYGLNNTRLVNSYGRSMLQAYSDMGKSPFFSQCGPKHEAAPSTESRTVQAQEPPSVPSTPPTTRVATRDVQSPPTVPPTSPPPTVSQPTYPQQASSVPSTVAGAGGSTASAVGSQGNIVGQGHGNIASSSVMDDLIKLLTALVTLGIGILTFWKKLLGLFTKKEK